jgi:hypothetical protein
VRILAVLISGIVFSLVAASYADSSSSTVEKIPGCAPKCLTPGGTTPGDLPAGRYKTRYFFAGQMTLVFPRGWTSDEDSTGEFSASPKATPDARVIFWEDVFAVTAVKPGTWRRDGPLMRTSASLLGWLQTNPNLAVSKPTTGKIGKIRARIVDVRVSANAVNDDPGCPAKACVNFLRFPQWDEPYGIAGKSITRFYLSDVRYGGVRHLFVVAVEAVGTAQLNALLPAAKKLIATVRVPAS